MSGGVDSSVAAALLQKEGYEVTGGFMRNWSQDLGQGCPWYEDEKDARRVTAKLEIPFYTFNFEKEYKERVLEEALSQFRAGLTPNPDVLCNSQIKFDLFLKKALELGADFVATGHYARIKRDNKGRIRLLKGRDKNKDQTYFLWQLKPEQLKDTLFPLGELEKGEVRRLAKEFGLPTALKPDSQGLCFVGQVPFEEFLKRFLGERPGEIRDTEGKKLGSHPGLHFFTIGQRKGLKLAGGPYYVVKKEPQTNTLRVAHLTEVEEHYQKEVRARQVNWLIKPRVQESFSCQAVIRYQQEPSRARVFLEEKRDHQIRVVFDRPQRAVAPGQSIVLYQGDLLLGGAVIQDKELLKRR